MSNHFPFSLCGFRRVTSKIVKFSPYCTNIHTIINTILYILSNDGHSQTSSRDGARLRPSNFFCCQISRSYKLRLACNSPVSRSYVACGLSNFHGSCVDISYEGRLQHTNYEQSSYVYPANGQLSKFDFFIKIWYNIIRK